MPAWYDPSLMQADADHSRQCQLGTILHSCRQTLIIRGSASLARSFIHADRRYSSEAVPALHDPSLMQPDAAHLRQCQPCTTLHSCRQTLLIRGSASLARSFTYAGRRCSSEAVPALHEPLLKQADAAYSRHCQPSTILHSCWQTLII